MMVPDYHPTVLSLCDYSGEWSRPYLEAGFCVVRVDPKHSLTNPGHGGRGLGYEGDGSFYQMDDGGYALAITAGELANGLEQEGGYFLDDIYQRRVGLDAFDGMDVWGVLAAPPCTDFSSSGARWFAAKDADGRTEASAKVVRDCLRVVEYASPYWWVLENPRGRIARVVPEVGKWLMHFNPCDYAGFADEPEREAYTKDTYLYGDFETRFPTAPVEPVYYTDNKGNRGSWQWKHLGGKSERTKELRSMTPQGFSRAFALGQLRAYAGDVAEELAMARDELFPPRS